MNLQLYIRDRLIGSIPIDIELASNPQYLTEKQKALENQHKEIIDKSEVKPTFLLESQSVTDNRRQGKK